MAAAVPAVRAAADPAVLAAGPVAFGPATAAAAISAARRPLVRLRSRPRYGGLGPDRPGRARSGAVRRLGLVPGGQGPRRRTGPGPDRLDRADLIAGSAAVGFWLAAVVVFIVWLWRVRRNSELFCQAQHRRRRGWVIGGWFCPIVNLWFPKQIVDDVIAASDPRTPPRVPDLRGIRANGLVLAWWITWVASLAIDNQGGTDPASDVPDIDDLMTTASLSTTSAVVTAACAVLAIRVITLVNRLQMSRPWSPWWATDPWAAPAGQPYGPVPTFGGAMTSGAGSPRPTRSTPPPRR